VWLWLRRDRIRQLGIAVRQVAERHRPDLIHMTLGELAPLIDEVEQPTGILLFDSLTREIESRLALETSPRRKAQLRLERRRTKRYERHWYARASGLASVSSVDAAWFADLLGKPVDVIENPIADQYFKPPEGPRSDNVVTFVGTLHHRPNTDAIEWLAGEIWPLVLAQRPDAKLVVVGRGDQHGVYARRLGDLVAQAGGRLDADVDDIRPYYWESAAVVAPMRQGAGMRNKVIHAMACRAPVVATPAALEGVANGAARQARIGSSAQELADAVVATLNDPERSRSRVDAAAAEMETLRSATVATRFGEWWERIAR
jgi:glycosyltransferase involved in cell wall biosynthesis